MSDEPQQIKQTVIIQVQPVLQSQPAPEHHYPFQGLANQDGFLSPCKPMEEHDIICDKENQSTIDHLIYHFNYKRWFCQQRQYWGKFDQVAANQITNFKSNYILSLGDVRVRSVLMAVSTAAFYKIISLRTNSLIGRTRNMAVSFGLMGITFIPQLFNPFLVFRKQP